MPESTPRQPTVSVRGEAILLTEPDLATLSITVAATGKDSASTYAALSKRAEALDALLGRAGDGIERSETSRLHVYPELEDRRTEKVRRFVGRMTTTVVVCDFAVLSDIVVGAAGLELATVSGPFWSLRETSDVYRQARLAAARDALRRARDYAAAFGAEIVGMVELADEGMSYPEQSSEGFAPLALGRAAAVPEDTSFDLEPAQQRVSGGVEARFVMSAPDLS